MSSVLIIEDDVAIRAMYEDKFLHEKFEVVTASNGQEGIEKMRQSKPDVILLDLMMPNVSGFNVLEKIKPDPVLNKIPIIVLTNIFADAEDLIKNWGVKYFLLKANCSPSDVVDKVRSIL